MKWNRSSGLTGFRSLSSAFVENCLVMSLAIADMRSEICWTTLGSVVTELSSSSTPPVTSA